jgi:LacI family transcriptional regulator
VTPPPSPSQRPKVALIVETSNAYGRSLIKGVIHYMRKHGPWSVQLFEQDWGERPDSIIRAWKGDGVIARIETPAMAAALSQLKVPMVDLSSARLVPSLPWFENDYRLIAKAALDHFRERGHRRFAVCGQFCHNWARWLGDHFAALVREAGYPCYVFDTSPKSEDRTEQLLAPWLKKLDKPVALLACNDFNGRMVLDLCRGEGILVPDEIAVLGEDNDEVFCELADPPLSSVQQNGLRVGYEAAAGLARLMRGEKLGNEGVFVAPIGVVTRQSTDVLAIEDRRVAKVVRYIREHACEGINVKDVLRHNPQSRRLLEARFKKTLGHSPHDEILNVRIARVKALLVETDLSLELISEQCGFAYVEYLSVVFKRVVGIAPSTYRREHKR